MDEKMKELLEAIPELQKQVDEYTEIKEMDCQIVITCKDGRVSIITKGGPVAAMFHLSGAIPQIAMKHWEKEDVSDVIDRTIERIKDQTEELLEGSEDEE